MTKREDEQVHTIAARVEKQGERENKSLWGATLTHKWEMQGEVS